MSSAEPERAEQHPMAPGTRQFIEDMGLRWEEEGFPRMAGRLVGWLLVCDPPHQTAGELAEVLGASAGSISTMMRILVQSGLVKRIAVPGQRSAGYRIRSGAWSEILGAWIEKARRTRLLAEQGLRLLEGRDEESRHRLQEFHEFHAFFERELPRLLERWRRESES